MGDEITNAEIQRSIEHLRRDLTEDLLKIEAALSRLLPREVYDLQRAGDIRRLDALERAIDAAAEQYAKDRTAAVEQRRQTVRWMVAAVAIPILGYLLQIVLSTHGVSP